MNLNNNPPVRDFAKERYLSLVKIFPQVKEPRTQLYFMVSLTFAAMTCLALFAISPTINTIVELNRKLEDSEFANDALKTKINNLSGLNAQHSSLINSWPKVEAAVPNEPKATYLLAQIQRIAAETGVSVINMQANEVELTKLTKPNQESSFTYTITVEGPKEAQMQFLQEVTHFNRVTLLESIAFSTEKGETLTVRIRSFFTP